ncbi:hypothetical protein FPSE_07590 [Fusarium pseudograminearum CS3096]|uniref:DUF6546 domain-containing protein n=1 Tax=Fusarium pseudograminearum (strain CS3096) TaxID=1028729 RepID=K3UJV0_FUSPC|nr:hypothetical protein FPSE_07590 [Fusarium pseudograminearum CS3096]EKJ72241.1 hypothetical protein FPSE_07590 [Fusarium pseudograminearum CS3096]
MTEWNGLPAEIRNKIVELEGFCCINCRSPSNRFLSSASDNKILMNGLEKLFKTLSTWEPRDDPLVLDISVYSPTDNQHWFKYLDFRPDNELDDASHEHERETAILDDPVHGWVAGENNSDAGILPTTALFDDIMCDKPFGSWWRSLPLVPVVGVVLLRQQTRRRWNQVALANMLSRFPNMKELCYEPWRQYAPLQLTTAADQQDIGNQELIESLRSTKLCKLTIFENFTEEYPEAGIVFPAVRVPDPDVSRKLARSSLHLTTLFASFMVDASHFFAECQDSWVWDNLTSLTLTSRALTESTDPLEINNMLHAAAAAAFKMPKLETMELWNGRRGVAMLFRYQRAQNWQPAIITLQGTLVLGTSLLALDDPTIVQAWDNVAYQHSHSKVEVVVQALIDSDKIRSHADAICHLGLSTVLRPVSLQQILREHRLRRTGHRDWY